MNVIYTIFFAPRGNQRMMELGMKITQMYLNPFDKIIGIIGDKDSGKSMLIKGMFPGIQVCECEDEFDAQNMPLFNSEDVGFYTPRTFHVDVRAASRFIPLKKIAEVVLEVAGKNKRVIVEHFENLYPVMGRNADLLIGIGEEVIVTRPNIFGPLPQNIADIVFKSLIYRKMAHSAEDLFEYCVNDLDRPKSTYSDIRHGFLLDYEKDPGFDLEEIEKKMLQLIEEDIPIIPYDEDHIKIKDTIMKCTGPRMHVESTGQIKNFSLYKEVFYDTKFGNYIVVGTVGTKEFESSRGLNKIEFQ